MSAVEALTALLWALLVAGVAYRTWRLFALDTITEDFRSALYDAVEAQQQHTDRERPPLWFFQYWLLCPWCSGTWFAVGFAVLGWIFGAIALPLVVGLCASVVVGFLGEVER